MAQTPLYGVPDSSDDGPEPGSPGPTRVGGRHAAPEERASVLPDAATVADLSADRSVGQEATALLVAISRGSEAAFVAFYRRFSAQVFGLARRVVRDPAQAEEVAQEVFLDIWRRASRFDPTKGSATSWVLTLTHSRAVERVRSAQAAADRDLRSAESTTERDLDSVVEAVEHRAERRAVQRCLTTLTDLQRQSVTLAYYGGYTYPQVAEMLQVPLPTIKTRMRDGLIRLRDCLRAAL
jgi:RNA polymerase sigma-70 factor (ECF subfamily)